MSNIRLIPTPQAEIVDLQRRIGHALKLRTELSLQLRELRTKTEITMAALEETDLALHNLEHYLGAFHGAK